MQRSSYPAMRVTNCGARWIRAAMVIASLAAVSACAPTTRMPSPSPELVVQEAEKEREVAFKDSIRDQARLAVVVYRIETANVEFCGKDVTARTGINLTDQDIVEKQLREAALKTLGVRDQPTVVAVVPSSPAAAAGLLPRDVITAVNAKETKTGKAGVKQITTAVQNAGGGPVELTIVRDGAVKSVTLTPVRGCSFPVDIQKSDSVNAFTDGRNIYVTSAMMSFARKDDELALIVGHEMGDVTMGRISSQTTNSMIGEVAAGVVGALLPGISGVDVMTPMIQAGSNLGTSAKGQAFESEADYVGTYYAARAGYDISDAGDLWRRLAASHPDAIHVGPLASHPSTAARFVALEQTVDEIKKKQTAKLALSPEKRNQPPTETAHSGSQPPPVQPAEITVPAAVSTPVAHGSTQAATNPSP